MIRAVTKQHAKSLMEVFPAASAQGSLNLWEVFREDDYTRATLVQQNATKLTLARWRCLADWRECNLDVFLPGIRPGELRGKSVLDLGCFTGGRLAP